MIKFGIDKLDKIVCQDRKVYILQKGRKGSGYPNFELRFCEYGLLKNLLEENIPCGVIHMTFGDTFQNMYQRYSEYPLYILIRITSHLLMHFHMFLLH